MPENTLQDQSLSLKKNFDTAHLIITENTTWKQESIPVGGVERAFVVRRWGVWSQGGYGPWRAVWSVILSIRGGGVVKGGVSRGCGVCVHRGDE